MSSDAVCCMLQLYWWWWRKCLDSCSVMHKEVMCCLASLKPASLWESFRGQSITRAHKSSKLQKRKKKKNLCYAILCVVTHLTYVFWLDWRARVLKIFENLFMFVNRASSFILLFIFTIIKNAYQQGSASANWYRWCMCFWGLYKWSLVGACGIYKCVLLSWMPPAEKASVCITALR